MILTDILEKNSKHFPNKPALTMRMGYRNLTLTYKQVYDLSRKVAIFLESNNINKGDKVLLFAQNSPYWGVLFWGAMLRGAVLVPINVQSTSKMIQKIIEQTECEIIFKSRFLKRDIPDTVKSYDIEFLDELVRDLKIEDFKVGEIDENDLVEILYTSGTTGDPKGVLLTHKNISSNLQALSGVLSFSSGKDRLLSILPLTHIFEQTIGFFLPISYASHVIYSHSYAAMLDLMQEYKITKIIAVPEFLKLLLSKIKAKVLKKGLQNSFYKLLTLSSTLNNKFISRLLFYPILRLFGGKLKLIGCGGALLEPELERDWIALGIDVLQGYGLTETSPVIANNNMKDHKLGSVGKILDNVEIKIADDGEILVKGPSVFTGYFNNAQKTAESFSDDGWFKTGDMGELDEDGFLFLKGRKKYIILGPGGQNVFPEDIESEVNKIDGVKDCCAIGIELSSGMIQIHVVLLLVAQLGSDNSYKDHNVEKIIEAANQNLASYQRIAAWSVWPEDDFPRSATKKVQKEKVLKYLLETKEDAVYSSRKETNHLVVILSQITGIPIVQIRDNTKVIKDLSLDSLMRVELVLRIEQDFGVAIDETLLKPETTVNQLQKIIDKKEPVKKLKLKKWPRYLLTQGIRLLFQPLFFLLSRIFIKLKIEGLDNLKDLDLPLIFMPNHISYLDSFVMAMAVPFRIRKKLTFAAAKDVLYEEYKHISWMIELFFNVFSFPRKEGENIRLGLEHMGKLLDKSFSVVVFPEGQMSVDGRLQKLKRGTGLIAVEMDSWVIPVKIIGTSNIVPYCKLLPRRRGEVIIKFGKPIKLNRSVKYDSATVQLEQSLRNL